MDDDDGARSSDDVMLVGPALGDDAHAVLRRREDRLEVGALRELREGRPLDGGGELVRLSRRGEGGRLFDVEVLAELPRRDGASGPPQVASEAYRQGWELVFGELPPSDEDLN